MLFAGVTGGATAARRRWSGTRWALFVAAFDVAAEWLTSLSPLPVNIALTRYRMLPVIPIASLTGIWGISFLLWLGYAALADSFLHVQPGKQPLGIALAALLLTLGYSILQFQAQNPKLCSEWLPFRITAVLRPPASFSLSLWIGMR